MNLTALRDRPTPGLAVFLHRKSRCRPEFSLPFSSGVTGLDQIGDIPPTFNPFLPPHGIITLAKSSLQNTFFKELRYQNPSSKGVMCSDFFRDCVRAVRSRSTPCAVTMMKRNKIRRKVRCHRGAVDFFVELPACLETYRIPTSGEEMVPLPSVPAFVPWMSPHCSHCLSPHCSPHCSSKNHLRQDGKPAQTNPDRSPEALGLDRELASKLLDIGKVHHPLGNGLSVLVSGLAIT